MFLRNRSNHKNRYHLQGKKSRQGDTQESIGSATEDYRQRRIVRASSHLWYYANSFSATIKCPVGDKSQFENVRVHSIFTLLLGTIHSSRCNTARSRAADAELSRNTPCINYRSSETVAGFVPTSTQYPTATQPQRNPNYRELWYTSGWITRCLM